jgi:hypothetical protein
MLTVQKMLYQCIFFVFLSAPFISACSASSSLQSERTSAIESQPEYFDNKELQYTDKIYEESIKTVILHIKGSELDAPIIPLNGDEKIILRFDDMD